MAFQNVFAAGTANVEVDADAMKVFSQEMVFSQSANFSFDGKNYTIALDAVGQITLTQVSTGSNNINWSIIVTPDYDITTALIQARSFSFDDSFINGNGSTASGASVSFTNLHPAAPDPMTLTGISANPNYISISATVGV